MFFTDVCSDFLAYIRHERGLTDRTCTTYSDWLSTYRRWCEGEAAGLTLSDRFNATILRRYLYSMSQRKLRPRTIRSAFSPLKAMGVYLVEQGVVAASPLDTIKMPKKDAAYRPVVSGQEVAVLLDACERLRTARRRAMGRAILLTLALCGIRFTELLDLKVDDIRPDLNTLTVRQGKGQKARTLYPSPTVILAISEWQAERRKLGTKGNQMGHDYLWAFDTKRRMGEMGIRALLEEIKAVAGLSSAKHVVPHAFRRFFATALAAQNGLQAASKALGHTELQTTLMYLSLQGEPARAMQSLEIPQHTVPPVRATPPPAPQPAPTNPTRTQDALRRRRLIGGTK